MAKINIPVVVEDDGTFQYLSKTYSNETSIAVLRTVEAKFQECLTAYKIEERLELTADKLGFINKWIKYFESLLSGDSQEPILNNTIEFNKAIIFGYNLAIAGDELRFLDIRYYAHDLSLNLLIYVDLAQTGISPNTGMPVTSFRSLKHFYLSETLDLILEGYAYAELLGHCRLLKLKLENEVLNSYQNKQPAIKEHKPKILTVPAIALLCRYLEMNGDNVLTNNNSNQVAERYGQKSGRNLLNIYNSFRTREQRTDINASNKRSASTHVERFENILPILKSKNDGAFQSAIDEFREVIRLYNQHHPTIKSKYL